MSRTISVNGESRPWQDMTMHELLAAEGVVPGKGGLAVALNNDVVPRTAWSETRLKPDDTVEIVHIVRGG